MDHGHHHHEGHTPPSDAGPGEHGVQHLPEGRGEHGEHGEHGAQGGRADHGAHMDHTAHAHPGTPAPAHASHDKHAGHSVAMFRNKFWISLLLTIPTLVWGEMIPQALGFTPPPVPGARWIAPVFGTAVFLYGGLVFLQGARHELADRTPGMMTLISLAISVAFLFSVAVTLGFRAMPLWWELASLVTIMLLGHWMEMRSITQAQGALKELAKLLPDTATRLEGQTTVEVPISELRAGTHVLVRPGARVPADGVVREGHSSLDESMITGESRLVDKHAGDEVIAGTVNGDGSLYVEVTRTGDRTALAGIMRLVSQAQQSRSRAQVLADRAAYYLTIVAVASAIVTAVTWLVLGASAAFIVERTVTVLVIACPHALGLAVPLVVAISTSIGAQNGLLVRDRRGLE
jgi:P-type Cu2+ transporter